MLAAAPPTRLPGSEDSAKATLIRPFAGVPKAFVGAEGGEVPGGVMLFETADSTLQPIVLCAAAVQV